MRGKTWLVVALILTLQLAMGGGVTATVTADEHDETVSPTPVGGHAVDDRVTLIDWSYNDTTEEFVLVFEAEVPRSVTISEAVSTEDARSGQLHVRSVALDRGETTVRMPTEPGSSGEAGVSIVTEHGLEDGTGVFVSTAQVQSNPLEHTTTTGGWIGGAGLAITFVVFAGLYKLRREESTPEVAT